jgi:hypothetical protein
VFFRTAIDWGNEQKVADSSFFKNKFAFFGRHNLTVCTNTLFISSQCKIPLKTVNTPRVFIGVSEIQTPLYLAHASRSKRSSLNFRHPYILLPNIRVSEIQTLLYILHPNIRVSEFQTPLYLDARDAGNTE